MKRDVTNAVSKSYDLVVIGGGVYGMCTAWDAALRGLSVILLEKNDFSHACSSANYKLIHGGLRYLQHLNINRMRVSIKERRSMMQIAPHLVSPIKFILPCYGHGMRGPEVMKVALVLNDLVGIDRNAGIDPSNQIPAGRLISKKDCIERVPGIQTEGLTGGAVYYDAQMYSAERLALSFGLSAHAAGATLLNYTEATRFHRAGDTIESVEVLDKQTNETHTVRGSVFVNMTGPWSEITRQQIQTDEPERYVVRSKGVQLITRSLAESGFVVQTKQKDKTAVISRGGRSLFVSPWRGHSFIGQSDTIYKGDPEHFAITEEDIQAFIDEFNSAYPVANLTRRDIKHVVGGMIPVGDDDPNGDAANISHKYEILDHADADGITNMISVIGVKFTISRYIAEKSVDMAVKKLNRRTPPCRTAGSPLVGGDFTGSIEEQASALAKAFKIKPEVARHLFHLYGANARELMDAWQQENGLEPLGPSCEAVKGEILHAVRNEMALHLDDFIFRRSDVGTAGYPGDETLTACANVMAQELGWSDEQTALEIDRVKTMYQHPSLG